MCLQFGFVTFWQKDFGAKAAHKMLVKFTPGGLRYFAFFRLCEDSKDLQNFGDFGPGTEDYE
jgi:hypothetical protein